MGTAPFADPGGKAKRCVPLTRTWTPWRDAQQKQNGTCAQISAIVDRRVGHVDVDVDAVGLGF